MPEFLSRAGVGVFVAVISVWTAAGSVQAAWDSYGLEAGAGSLPWKLRQAKDAGENPERLQADNLLFDVVKSRLK